MGLYQQRCSFRANFHSQRKRGPTIIEKCIRPSRSSNDIEFTGQTDTQNNVKRNATQLSIDCRCIGRRLDSKSFSSSSRSSGHWFLDRVFVKYDDDHVTCSFLFRWQQPSKWLRTSTCPVVDRRPGLVFRSNGHVVDYDEHCSSRNFKIFTTWSTEIG